MTSGGEGREQERNKPDISERFRKLLAEYSYEIRNGDAHRAVEAEMMRNIRR